MNVKLSLDDRAQIGSEEFRRRKTKKTPQPLCPRKAGARSKTSSLASGQFALLLIAGLCFPFPGQSGTAEDSAPADLVPARTSEVDFVRDIQPIFQKACVQCHGPEKQKGGFRLDVRAGAFTLGDSYAPSIVPGKSAESHLVQFVSGTGDLVMPPSGERLTDIEIGLLKSWIDQGANWPDAVAGHLEDKHDLWSLKPLIRPSVPVPLQASNDLSPIDAFLQQKREEHKLPSNPEADRRTLIRRVSLNLTGLPPTSAEVDAFVSDPDPLAYEHLVDRLLESPRYGERWARHWLDAAHFAETHGNDQDRIREHAWPYRDYLIKSLNEDKPFGRFVQEQVAGDVLYPEDPTATAALGFLAAGPWDESSLRDIREDTLDRQIARYLDRDDMLGNVISNFCSLTVQCARCHDHKFDPISQRDYYALQAVFSGVERANRRYDQDLQIHQQRLALNQKKRLLEQRNPEQLSWLNSPEVQQKVLAWEQSLQVQEANWIVVDSQSFTSSDGAHLVKLADGSILSGGPRPDKDTVTIAWTPHFPVESACDSVVATSTEKPTDSQVAADPASLIRITAIRLEVLTDDSLPRGGPGRQDNGNLHLSEFEVFADDHKQPIPLINASADFNQQGWEVSKSIDQNEPTAWGIDPKEGVPHRAVYELKVPIELGPAGETVPCLKGAGEANQTPKKAARLQFVLKQLHGRGHLIGRMRLSVTSADPPVGATQVPAEIAAILAIPAAQRTEGQRWELAIFQQLEEVTRTLAALPTPNLVYAAAADFEPDGSLRPPPGPRPVHVLHRGDIRQPREEVKPGGLSCLSAIPSKFEIPENAPESSRRAALAAWIISQDNVLTWRSIVNRVWHHHFGRGLVPTLNDFGHMGERPSHPELLDWLAVEFRDGGQSLKRLHRLIVTSRAYRQSSAIPSSEPNSAEPNPSTTHLPNLTTSLDADNRLLWRMNRTRLDAESLRDSILAISGRLDLRMGGPSDRQFDLQPGIHVTPKVDYVKFDPSHELGRRRSIYRFLFRTLPDPFMESLDCPSGDQITPSRTNSVTVQQALAMWNDVFMTRHCEFIGERIEEDVSANLPDHEDAETRLSASIRQAFRKILLRDPTQSETADVAAYTRKHGIANLCRLLINSNEFMFVN